jgi:hypothetical protein
VRRGDQFRQPRSQVGLGQPAAPSWDRQFSLFVPTENSILLKKRKRHARGNEICWALRLPCSHLLGPRMKVPHRDEAQIDCGA